MRYAIERIRREQEQMAYRLYVTQCLAAIAENTARITGGRYVSLKFSEILHPVKHDDRPVQVQVDDVIKKAGLEVIKS